MWILDGDGDEDDGDDEEDTIFEGGIQFSQVSHDEFFISTW